MTIALHFFQKANQSINSALILMMIQKICSKFNKLKIQNKQKNYNIDQLQCYQAPQLLKMNNS